MTIPGEPHIETRVDSEADPLGRLCSGVEDALRSLPVHFRSTTNIEGIQATDLFALNTLLATTIETRVVETLNRTRSVWDPEGEWNTHSFQRQAQTFPDVRLVSRRGSEIEIALGIELKGWYLLAKEGMPSLRLTVNPAACAPHDLVAVVPWYLSNVLSGVPSVLEPWVHNARAAAEHRNHWWTEVRVTTTDPRIDHPADPVHPYPNKADEVADKPVADRGGNFGRLARTGIMDDFLRASLHTSVAGIAADHWIKFFKIYSEPVDRTRIDEWLERRLDQAFRTGTEEVGHQVLQLLHEVRRLLAGD